MIKGKLVIISHTEHFKDSNAAIVGLGSTVTEINAISPHFKEIVHIAVLHKIAAPSYCLEYSKKNIRFIPLNPTGGKTLWLKLKIILSMCFTIQVIRKELIDAEYVQMRLPTGIGIFLLPYFAITKGKRKFKLWVKYAGNWNESKSPLSYAFQRWFLKKDFCQCQVTINGFWPEQPKNCISFENPCLTEEQLQIGKQMLFQKKFEPPFNFVFVGRLEEAKGVGVIIEALREVDNRLINTVKFIGDGPKRSEYEDRTKNLYGINYLGWLNNQMVHNELRHAHFLLLPSYSEGFPKVIAEAACYGVLPIVSDVGSINHYINEQNGFLCKREILDQSLRSQLQNALNTDITKLKQKSILVYQIAGLFTYNSYIEKLAFLEQ